MTTPPILKQSDAERARWFSTGFLASGVESVSPEQHALRSAAVIRCGEARGHDMFVDSEMCRQVMEAGNAPGDKGLKARFGHPDMCADALGTFLGRWKGLSAGSDGVVRGDLFLSSTAAESPKGDLRNYIEQLAAKEPGHFGTSIVFSRDWEAEEDFGVANGAEFVFGAFGMYGFAEAGRCKERAAIPAECDYYVDWSAFKSPDPLNAQNFPHARLAKLHAADLVDDPAATDGMFSGAGGAALAARTSEWLDTHPEILAAFSKEPDMLGILERYAAQIRPFVERYAANHPLAAPAEPAAEPAQPPPTPAETDAELTARLTGLESQLAASAEQIERLAAQNGVLASDKETLSADLDSARQKLAELLSAQAPVSAGPAETTHPGDFWTTVRKSHPSRK